jgi:hypothetical protein
VENIHYSNKKNMTNKWTPYSSAREVPFLFVLFVKRLTDLHLPVQAFLAEYNICFDNRSCNAGLVQALDHFLTMWYNISIQQLISFPWEGDFILGVHPSKSDKYHMGPNIHSRVWPHTVLLSLSWKKGAKIWKCCFHQ